MREIGVAFIEREEKMQLASPDNSHCGRRTLQAQPGRYGAFFLLSFPFCLARENMVVVPMFNRVHKDWFDVCLCLWIVKTIMPPESGHDPLGRRSFSYSPDFYVCCISSCEMFQCRPMTFRFYGMSLMRSGVGFSRLAMILSSHQLCSDSAQNKMKLTAPKVVRNMSGASIPSDRLRRGDCISFFLLGWRCDFDVVYDLANSRHCSR